MYEFYILQVAYVEVMLLLTLASAINAAMFCVLIIKRIFHRPRVIRAKSTESKKAQE